LWRRQLPAFSAQALRDQPSSKGFRSRQGARTGLRQAMMSQNQQTERLGPAAVSMEAGASARAAPGAGATSEALAGLLRAQAAPDALAPLLRGARAEL